MTTAGAAVCLLQASVCVVCGQRMNHYPCGLTWMNFDRGNMGQSALGCWSMICGCLLRNWEEREVTKHSQSQSFSVALSRFGLFFSADAEWCCGTKPTPADLPSLIHFKCSIMAKDPFLDLWICAPWTLFLFMKLRPPVGPTEWKRKESFSQSSPVAHARLPTWIFNVVTALSADTVWLDCIMSTLHVVWKPILGTPPVHCWRHCATNWTGRCLHLKFKICCMVSLKTSSRCTSVGRTELLMWRCRTSINRTICRIHLCFVVER